MGLYHILDQGELDGYPVETWTKDGLTAVVQFDTSWENRNVIPPYLLAGGEEGGPRRYPRNSFVNCFVKTVVFRPFGASSELFPGAITYEKARFTVNYGPPDAGEAIDATSESLEPSAEFITLDHKGLVWGADDGPPLKEAEAPGKLIRTFDYVKTFFGLEELPTSMLTYVGSCNEFEVTAVSLGLTFPAQTLLFNPPTASRTTNSEGEGKWDLTYRLTYRPDTWNKFWRQESDDFDEIWHAGGTQYFNFPLIDWGTDI